MVPDSSPRSSKGVLVLAWRLCRTFLQGDRPFSVAFCSGGCARAHPPGVAHEAVFGCNDRTGWDGTIPQIRLFGSGSRVGTVLSCVVPVVPQNWRDERGRQGTIPS
jgi:hypothetical protein